MPGLWSQIAPFLIPFFLCLAFFVCFYNTTTDYFGAEMSSSNWYKCKRNEIKLLLVHLSWKTSKFFVGNLSQTESPRFCHRWHKGDVETV